MMLPGMVICTAPERLAQIEAPVTTDWSATYPPLLQGTLLHHNPVQVRLFVQTGWDPSGWDSNDVESRVDYQIIDQVTSSVLREGYLPTMPGPHSNRWRSLPLGLLLRFRDDSISTTEGDEVTWEVAPLRMAGPFYEELDLSAALQNANPSGGADELIPRVEQHPDQRLNYNILVDGTARPLEGPMSQSWRIVGGMGEDVRGQLQEWRENGREVVFYPPYTKDTRLLAHFQDAILPEIGGHATFTRGDDVAWYERAAGAWGRVSGDFPRFMPSPWVGRALVAEAAATNLYYPSSPISDANLGPTTIPSGSGHVVTRDTAVPLPVEGHHSCLRWRRGSNNLSKMEWQITLTSSTTAWVFSVFLRGATGVDGSGNSEVYLTSDATTYTSTTRTVLTDQWQRVFIHGVGGQAGTTLTVQLNADSTPSQNNDVIFVDGWMAQETGTTGASDHAMGFGPSGYIHTTTASVTRAAETVRVYQDDIPGDQGFLSFWMQHIATEFAYVGSYQVESAILKSNGATAALEFGVLGRSSPDESGYYITYRGTRVEFYGSTGSDFPEAFEPMHVGIRWKSAGAGNDITLALFINGVKLDEITDGSTLMYGSLGARWDLTQKARGLPIGEMRMDRTALTDAEVLAYYQWLTGTDSKPIAQTLLGRQFSLGRIRARRIRMGTHQLLALEIPMIEGTVTPEFQAVKAREDISRGRV